jgi:hypothetical protein
MFEDGRREEGREEGCGVGMVEVEVEVEVRYMVW